MFQWGDPVPTMDKIGKPVLWIAIMFLVATVIAQIVMWEG